MQYFYNIVGHFKVVYIIQRTLISVFIPFIFTYLRVSLLGLGMMKQTRPTQRCVRMKEQINAVGQVLDLRLVYKLFL
jgi:hypothetical protein